MSQLDPNALNDSVVRERKMVNLEQQWQNGHPAVTNKGHRVSTLIPAWNFSQMREDFPFSILFQEPSANRKEKEIYSSQTAYD